MTDKTIIEFGFRIISRINYADFAAVIHLSLPPRWITGG